MEKMNMVNCSDGANASRNDISKILTVYLMNGSVYINCICERQSKWPKKVKCFI